MEDSPTPSEPMKAPLHKDSWKATKIHGRQAFPIMKPASVHLLLCSSSSFGHSTASTLVFISNPSNPAPSNSSQIQSKHAKSMTFLLSTAKYHARFTKAHRSSRPAPDLARFLSNSSPRETRSFLRHKTGRLLHPAGIESILLLARRDTPRPPRPSPLPIKPLFCNPSVAANPLSAAAAAAFTSLSLRRRLRPRLVNWCVRPVGEAMASKEAYVRSGGEAKRIKREVIDTEKEAELEAKLVAKTVTRGNFSVPNLAISRVDAVNKKNLALARSYTTISVILKVKHISVIFSRIKGEVDTVCDNAVKAAVSEIRTLASALRREIAELGGKPLKNRWSIGGRPIAMLFFSFGYLGLGCLSWCVLQTYSMSFSGFGYHVLQ